MVDWKTAFSLSSRTVKFIWNDISANIKCCFIALCFMLLFFLLHALWLLSGSNLYLLFLCCLMPSVLWPCALFFVAPLSFYLATCNNLCWLVLVLYGICVLWYDNIIIVFARWYHASWLVAFYIGNGGHHILWRLGGNHSISRGRAGIFSK